MAFVNDNGKETPLGFRQRLGAPDNDFPNRMITSRHELFLSDVVGGPLAH
jgi:hypothetical protein